MTGETLHGHLYSLAMADRSCWRLMACDATLAPLADLFAAGYLLSIFSRGGAGAQRKYFSYSAS